MAAAPLTSTGTSSSTTATHLTYQPLTTIYTPRAGCLSDFNSDWYYTNTDGGSTVMSLELNGASSCYPLIPDDDGGSSTFPLDHTYSPGICPSDFAVVSSTAFSNTLFVSTCCPPSMTFVGTGTSLNCYSMMTPTSIPANPTILIWPAQIVFWAPTDLVAFTPRSAPLIAADGTTSAFSTSSTTTSSSSSPSSASATSTTSTPSSTGTSQTASPSPSNSDHGLSGGAKGGIAAGVIIGVLLILAIAGVWFWVMRRRRPQRPLENNNGDNGNNTDNGNDADNGNIGDYGNSVDNSNYGQNINSYRPIPTEVSEYYAKPELPGSDSEIRRPELSPEQDLKELTSDQAAAEVDISRRHYYELDGGWRGYEASVPERQL